MTLNPDLFLAILSMDSYNRGYGIGINMPTSGQLGRATISRQSNVAFNSTEVASGFYALAYDVSRAGIAGLTGTVISYRGSCRALLRDMIFGFTRRVRRF